MGLDYESFNRYEFYQYDSLVPFFNLREEKNGKKSETEETKKVKDYSKIKNFNSFKITSMSRKSTIDIDE